MAKRMSGTLALGLLLLSLLLPAAAFANAPAAPASFTILVTDPPAGCYGVDFLLPKAQLKADGCFCGSGTALKTAGLSPSCELASLDSDGYVSYLAHYENAVFSGGLEPSDEEAGALTVRDFGRFDAVSSFDYIAYDTSDMKLALFDKDGRVLAVSEPFSIIERPIDSTRGRLVFHAATGVVMTDTCIPPTALVIWLYACLLTVGLEVLIGLLFRIHPLYWVTAVTAGTNLLMNALLFLLCLVLRRPLPYIPTLIVLEVAVVAGEYLLYRRLCPKMGKVRLLLFSVTANLISAGAAVVLNLMFR